MYGRRAYPSDGTDEEWEILEPLIPQGKPGGRPVEIARREMVNAILYVLRSAYPWRYLPHEFPRWFTLYSYFRRWKLDGTWERIHHALRRDFRAAAGREPEPSAAIVDSQSIKTSPVRGDARGYDGGKKRHLLVDTLGLVRAVKVLAADITDREGGKMLLGTLQTKLPRLQ
jgi:putative transposase